MWEGAKIRTYGPVAQLGERSVRIREVDGSIPFRSTKLEIAAVKTAAIFCFAYVGWKGRCSLNGTPESCKSEHEKC